MQRPHLLALAFLAAACGGSSNNGGGSSNDGGDAGTVVNCQTDSRVVAYAPNIAVKAAPSNAITWTLTQATPAPPARDINTWTVHAADASGQALPALNMSVKTLMPDHGHGSPTVPTVTNQGGGNYKIDQLYLF